MPGVDLAGVFIPTVTPFAPRGEVDLDAFEGNVRAWSETGIHGFVVGGSTGEALLLDAAERLNLWTATREVAPDLVLIAGTGAESTRTTIRMCRAAAQAGADAVLVQPPAFYRGAMTREALADHFRAVAEGSPVPVILYQVPLRMSTLDLATALIAELSEHDNIVGVKDSRGKLELIRELVDATSTGFQVLVGSGALLQSALEAGAVGGILGVANVVPDLCAGIFAAHGRGDAAEAAAIQSRVAPLHTGIVGGMGVPGVKFAVDLVGRAGGSPRSPLRPLPQTGRSEVTRLLADAGLISN
jgi:dihydrodipicolinate synthase/N-acetylneuraminate lyase